MSRSLDRLGLFATGLFFSALSVLIPQRAAYSQSIKQQPAYSQTNPQFVKQYCSGFDVYGLTDAETGRPYRSNIVVPRILQWEKEKTEFDPWVHNSFGEPNSELGWTQLHKRTPVGKGMIINWGRDVEPGLHAIAVQVYSNNEHVDSWYRRHGIYGWNILCYVLVDVPPHARRVRNNIDDRFWTEHADEPDITSVESIGTSDIFSVYGEKYQILSAH